MQRAIPRYEQRFVYRDISLQELKQLEKAVSVRFGANMYCTEVKSVEPHAFKQKFVVSWREFETLYKKYKAQFRRYMFCFYPGRRSGAAPITRVEFELFVVMSSKYGDRDEGTRSIELRGLGCYEADYNDFVRIATQVLHLEKAPPFGMDHDDESICAKWDFALHNTDLRRVTQGAIRTRHYDEALKSAVVLVESKLREKCLWAGQSNAQHQNGTDLANTAFDATSGCLVPPWPVATRALDGVKLLFMGFFLYLRNAFGHHSVVMGSDKSSVFEMLALCDFLLCVLEKSVSRKGVQP